MSLIRSLHFSTSTGWRNAILQGAYGRKGLTPNLHNLHDRKQSTRSIGGHDWQEEYRAGKATALTTQQITYAKRDVPGRG